MPQKGPFPPAAMFVLHPMYLFKSVMWHLLKWVLCLFFGGSVMVVACYRFLPVPVTPLMLIRLVQQHNKGDELRLSHHWVPLSEMSEELPVAVMASEDQLFMEHHGFDVKAIEDAAIERIRGGRRRGGSTISQQTAKNVFLWPTSSWIRKGMEAYFTLLIETMWSKRRIMEVYLNSIEMGRGIYGAEAVARAHFRHGAKTLSRQECALIAATLPNPLKFNSAYPSSYIQKRKRAILREMRYVRRAVELSPLKKHDTAD